MCEECWATRVGKQQFDGVAIDAQSKPKRLLIVEVKRMADTMADYWQRGVDVAEKQYADLCEGIKRSLPSEWECRFVPVILGTMSISEKTFGEAMEQLGITKAAIVSDTRLTSTMSSRFGLLWASMATPSNLCFPTLVAQHSSHIESFSRLLAACVVY